VLFIAVDDPNNWIGCMGSHPHAITPNIDRLAKEGILFLNNHRQAPICGPSRTSVMTGLSHGPWNRARRLLATTENHLQSQILFHYFVCTTNSREMYLQPVIMRHAGTNECAF